MTRGSAFLLLQDKARREGTPEAKIEIRPHRDQPHDWKLNEALRNHNTAMNLLSDSNHHTDQEKGQLVDDNRSQMEKPKAADAKKRGRPRKSAKSPKRNYRTSDESLKNSKSRNRTTRLTGQAVKRKQPISKATLPTTDDDDSDDSRSHGVSSDSVSDHRSNNVSNNVAAIPEKRIRLSRLSSSDDDSPPNRKNNSASEEDTARWRGVSIKRTKLADGSKKQDKRKSSTKAKPRRSRSRMANVTGGGSDSESESGMSVRNNRIQVAR